MNSTLAEGQARQSSENAADHFESVLSSSYSKGYTENQQRYDMGANSNRSTSPTNYSQAGFKLGSQNNPKYDMVDGSKSPPMLYSGLPVLLSASRQGQIQYPNLQDAKVGSQSPKSGMQLNLTKNTFMEKEKQLQVYM